MSPRSPRDQPSSPDPQPLASLAALDAIEAPPALQATVQAMADEATAGRRPKTAPRSRWDTLPGLRLRRRSSAGNSAQRLHGTPHPERATSRPRWTGAGAIAGAVAVAAVVLAVVLSGGGSAQPPTVLETSRLALAAATRGAPAESESRPGRLALAVDGVPFPYWGGRVGWSAVGARVDHLGGRAVTTVFYAGANGGARIGYAIVAGPVLPVPAAGRTVWRGGVRFTVLNTGQRPGTTGATVVTWRERGHTCVLAARAVPAQALVALAS